MSQGSRRFVRRRENMQSTTPNRLSIERKEYAHLENMNLVDDFAKWLTDITGETVTTENFCADLKDGRILCEFVSRFEGSKVTKWHTLQGVEEDVQSMQDFMAMENLITFQKACKRLDVPAICSVSDFRDENADRIVSCLIFLADVALERDLKLKDDFGNTVEMPEDIRERVDTMRSERAPSIQSSVEPLAALPATPEVEDVVEKTGWQAWLDKTIESVMVALGLRSKA